MPNAFRFEFIFSQVSSFSGDSAIVFYFIHRKKILSIRYFSRYFIKIVFVANLSPFCRHGSYKYKKSIDIIYTSLHCELNGANDELNQSYFTAFRIVMQGYSLFYK